MAPLDSGLRKTRSTPFQRLVRYYTQHGPLALTSAGLRLLLTELAGSYVKRYIDSKSLYRDELLDSVPNEQVWYYGSAETYSIDDPLHLGELPERFQAASGELTRKQPFVCEVEDAEICGPTANPKASNGLYIRDAQGLAQGQFLRSLVTEWVSRVNPIRRRSSDEIECGVLFTNLWSGNPYHWQIDLLPRLRGVEEYERRRGKKPTLVVCQNLTEWQLEYLDLLGYAPGDWYNYTGKNLRVRNLVVPYSARFQRSQLEWVRDRILSNVSAASNKYPSKIYISRDDALCRRVVNEGELMRELRDRGFERVVLSDMSVESQVNMFAQADCIIGAHGAGFANLMYATDVSVVELYGVKEHASTLNLAGILGHTYGCVRCETIGEDLVVDVSDVIDLIEQT